MTFNTEKQYATLESSSSVTVKRGVFGQLADADDGLIYRDKGTPEHEYVDLGLSVRWATCNVGASKPEEYGDHFAWGETTGYNDGKTVFEWTTCKWCCGSYNTLTKYNTMTDYGTVDNKTVLDAEDDVAHVRRGGSWRMPTDAEWTELRDDCTWTWTTVSLSVPFQNLPWHSLLSRFLSLRSSCWLCAGVRRQDTSQTSYPSSPWISRQVAVSH